MTTLAVRCGHDDRVEPINPMRATRLALAEEAMFRRVSIPVLIEQLLDAIAEGDRFGDVLGGKAATR